jgi:uncharacterized protein (DUF433 family)
MTVIEVGEHIVIDPEVVHGRMTFKGTRVPVDLVLEYIEDGLSVDDVEKHWPPVSREAAQEAVRLAADALRMRFAAELDAADDEARRRWDAKFGTNKVQEKAEATALARANGQTEVRAAGL